MIGEIDLSVFDKGIELADCRSTPAAVMHVLCQKNRPDVIEIGTAYGEHLRFFSSMCGCVVSIDCMYDWVPDVGPNKKFDDKLVDEKKVAKWKENASDNCSLIVGRSYDVHSSLMHVTALSGGFDVLIIDGDHSSSKGIEMDYFSYSRFMRHPHVVIFDDVNVKAVGDGVKAVKEKLREIDISFVDRDVKLISFKPIATVMVVGS